MGKGLEQILKKRGHPSGQWTQVTGLPSHWAVRGRAPPATSRAGAAGRHAAATGQPLAVAGAEHTSPMVQHPTLICGLCAARGCTSHPEPGCCGFTMQTCKEFWTLASGVSPGAGVRVWQGHPLWRLQGATPSPLQLLGAPTFSNAPTLSSEPARHVPISLCFCPTRTHPMASEHYLCPRGLITDTTDQDPPQAGAQAARQQGWAFQGPDGASPSVFTWGFWGNT